MMTNTLDSKRKATSQGMDDDASTPRRRRPSKNEKMSSSNNFVLDAATRITCAGIEATNTPLTSTRCDTRTQHVQEQQEQQSDDEDKEHCEFDESESEESDDKDSEYQDQENDNVPPLCQRATNTRCTNVNREEDEIRNIRADIAMMEARIVQTRNRVTVLDEEIKEAAAELMTFSTSNIRLSLLYPFENLPITFDFSSMSRRETQAYHLRCKVKDLSMMRSIAAMQDRMTGPTLDSLRVKLRRALNRRQGGAVRTSRDAKRDAVARQSGIWYSPDRRRIGLVAAGPSFDIGLVEMEEEQVTLKEIILIGDFSQILEKAWRLCSIDVCEQLFFKELVKLVPRLSEKLLKNAWLALNMHCEGKDENTSSTVAGNGSHQYGIYMPFNMLLKAAAVEEGLVNSSSFTAGQDVYSSLSITFEDDGRFHERKLAIKPTAAATLYQGWDVFGMMEIKKTSQSSNDGSELMEYDRCVLMTAVTAVALKRFIKSSDYDKVALPFIIWSGYNASLYVTRLDRRGNPTVCTIGYPCGEDGTIQNLALSPCAAATKLFLAFAVLLHEFKSFFESSAAKTSYYENVQKCITLLETIEEYTPTGLTTDCSSTRTIKASGKRRKQV